jgi:Domain of unknown function (DU1801)
MAVPWHVLKTRRLYVSAFKNHVNVGFFCVAMLEDPTRLLEGSGKRMRHIKFAPRR